MAWRRCDDIDGSIEDVEPVDLGFEGQVYLLHLGPKNREMLRDQIAPWIEGIDPSRAMGVVMDGPPKPLSASKPMRTAKSGTKSRPAVREDTPQIRRWARDNGFSLKGMGRVPNDVILAYDAAHA